MKNLALLIIGVILLCYHRTLSQDQIATDNLYYVVIGVFANPKNAAEFTEHVKKKNINARTTYNEFRKLYYVYIYETPEKENAVSWAVKLQSEPEFSDTWVYSNIPPGQTASDSAVVTEEVKQVVLEPAKPADGSKAFIFKIRNIETGQEVAGDVDIFDADIIKGRKVISYRGNDVVNVKPINKSGNLVVLCDMFGYRKVQLPINFIEPKIEDAVSIENGNIAINFDLVRLKKGDTVVMYNVYFFNHAAIMRPESRYEMNALLEYLKEKSTSKIRIHGHTNGNEYGQIITLGKSNDHFRLSPDNSEGKGSSLKLSEERARIIQSYLVNQGIDIKRMELKAWGGKRPIYDEDHSLAHANVRVEIEILEE